MRAVVHPPRRFGSHSERPKSRLSVATYGPRHRRAHCGSRGGPYTTSGYVLFDAVRSGWTKRGIKYVAVVEQTGGVLVVAKSPANALIPLAAPDAQSSELPPLIHKQPAGAKLAGNREAVP
jgi:hypothetical protein